MSHTTCPKGACCCSLNLYFTSEKNHNFTIDSLGEDSVCCATLVSSQTVLVKIRIFSLVKYKMDLVPCTVSQSHTAKYGLALT